MNKQHAILGGALSLAAIVSIAVLADQVVVDDQVVQGSMCVGTECVDGEEFDFDTIRIKSGAPLINFQDTSNSASFPTNDWLMGIEDDVATGSASFFITDVTSGSDVLRLQAADQGGVALGAGSTVVPDAISIGAVGAERPIVNMAAGTDDNDAVNVAQFDAFQADAAGQAAAIDADVAAAQTRIDALNTRIDALISRVDALENP
jgi:hypothetical protein